MLYLQMHLDLVYNRWCTMCFAAGWIGLGYYDACLCIIDADTSLTVSRSKRSPIFSFLFFFQKSLILFPRIYTKLQIFGGRRFSRSQMFKSQFSPLLLQTVEIYSCRNIEKNGEHRVALGIRVQRVGVMRI